MIPYSEALQHLLDAATPLPAEHLPLHEAAGRVLASDIHSAQSLPPFDNSAMDGFALRANGATFEAGTGFAVQGWQAAGDAGAEGGEGAWEIMTGARMPSGLDTVVPVENVEILASEDGRPTRIALKGMVKPGQNVRLRGQDVSDGDRVLQAGQVLDTNARTLLHAIGVGKVAMVARPKVAVIATGKELVTEAVQTLESGQIRDSNRPYLVGRLQAAGAEVVWQGTVGDEAQLLRQPSFRLRRAPWRQPLPHGHGRWLRRADDPSRPGPAVRQGCAHATLPACAGCRRALRPASWREHHP